MTAAAPVKPRSNSCAALTARTAGDGEPSTTAISRLPLRVAVATTLKPDAQMKPVFMPSAPAIAADQVLWLR